MPMEWSAGVVIHPTAVVDPQVQLAEGVRIGPYAVIEGPVRIGAGTQIGPHVHICGPVRLGRNNWIGTGCVIGAPPQHLGYRGEVTAVEIGDDNIFREYVTVHRGLPVGLGAGSGLTRIGDRNLLMVGSHVAHDCRVGNDCILANYALIAGHVELGDRALISGNSAVHQHCRVGRLALLSGVSACSFDIPPFWIMQGHNIVRGINLVGMRRAGLPAADIQAVRRAFAILYRHGLPLRAALQQIEAECSESPAVQELLEFVRSPRRGIPGAHRLAGRDGENGPLEQAA